jgi:hypothetical protein
MSSLRNQLASSAQQIDTQSADNTNLKVQLDKVTTEAAGLRGQLELQSSRHRDKLAALEAQHQQQLQQQVALLQQQAAELQVGACAAEHLV